MCFFLQGLQQLTQILEWSDPGKGNLAEEQDERTAPRLIDQASTFCPVGRRSALLYLQLKAYKSHITNLWKRFFLAGGSSHSRIARRGRGRDLRFRSYDTHAAVYVDASRFSSMLVEAPDKRHVNEERKKTYRIHYPMGQGKVKDELKMTKATLSFGIWYSKGNWAYHGGLGKQRMDEKEEKGFTDENLGRANPDPIIKHIPTTIDWEIYHDRAVVASTLATAWVNKTTHDLPALGHELKALNAFQTMSRGLEL
ncbi:hypothetical protein C8J56DRAFT_904756 [Mycena floridula]|nr:hypothetical protein C8J56DRAFT_904756 [Mycena floridula]